MPSTSPWPWSSILGGVLWEYVVEMVQVVAGVEVENRFAFPFATCAKGSSSGTNAVC